MEIQKLIENLKWTRDQVAEKNNLESKIRIAEEESDRLRKHFPFKDWTSPLKKRYWAIAIAGLCSSTTLEKIFPPLKAFDEGFLLGIYNQLNPVEGDFLGGLDVVLYTSGLFLAPYVILMAAIRLSSNNLTKPSRLSKAYRNDSLVKDWGSQLKHIKQELEIKKDGENKTVVRSKEHLNLDALDFFINALDNGEANTYQECVQAYNTAKRTKEELGKIKDEIISGISASINDTMDYVDSEMSSMSSKIDDLERENRSLHNRY